MLPLDRPARPCRGALHRRAGRPPPAQPAALLRDRRGLARRRPVLSLPRAPDAARPGASTAAARCRSPPPTPPRWRSTSRRCSTRSTASSRRATGPPGSSPGMACRPSASTCCRTTSPPSRSRRAHGAADGRYALVAARLSAEKGIDTAIRASAASGVPLVIAGEGPEAAALGELAAEPRRAGGAGRPRGPRAHGGAARGRRRAADALALPRVRPLLGARGDGGRGAGGGVAPRWPPGADRALALRAARRRRRPWRAACGPCGTTRRCAARRARRCGRGRRSATRSRRTSGGCWGSTARP